MAISLPSADCPTYPKSRQNSSRRRRPALPTAPLHLLSIILTNAFIRKRNLERHLEKKEDLFSRTSPSEETQFSLLLNGFTGGQRLLNKMKRPLRKELPVQLSLVIVA